MTTPSPDPETMAYLLELVELEKSGERGMLAIGPWTAFTLVGMIQLATRHPEMGAESYAIMRSLGGQIIEGMFGGTPGEALLSAGWDVSQDVPLDGTDPPCSDAR